MKQTLYVIALPTDKIGPAQLMKLRSSGRFHVSHPKCGISDSNEAWQGFHIYFTSQDEKEISSGDNIFEGITKSIWTDVKTWNPECKKIIASTDYSITENSVIPLSFINLYAEKQGSIKEVQIEIEQCETHLADACNVRFNCCNNPYKIKINTDNTVIWSLKQEKQGLNLQALKAAHHAGVIWASGRKIITKRDREDEFDSWYKENIDIL